MVNPTNKVLLDTGADSDVYLIKDLDCVMKVYVGLREGLLHPIEYDRCFSFIERYNADTLKAKDILDSDWHRAPKNIREITLNNRVYKITPKILEQGNIKICRSLNEVVSIGQKYLHEFNLQKVCQGYYHNNKEYSALSRSGDKLLDNMQYGLDLFTSKIGVPFNLAKKNITPILNESTMTIDVMITDLIGGIGQTYSKIFSVPYFQIR